MSFVMSFTGLPSAIGNALISVSSNKYVILLIINLVLLVVGIVLCMTVVGLIAGIPLCILGAVMMFKSLFVCHRNDR